MKKYQSNLTIILFFIIILFIIIPYMFLSPLSHIDEVWNFQSIYKMYNSGLIYNDNNVIITPIFFILGNALFHFFDANLLVFRLYNVIIFLIKYIFMFIIFKKLNCKNIHSALYVLLWLTIDSSCISCGANYNQLGLVFCLFGAIWYITHYNKKFYHLIQGIIIFLIFFTKQTIGVYYAFGIVLFELLEIGFHKKFWINQFTKLSTFLPCLLISLFIMYLQGNLIQFINLCFGSLLEFGNSNTLFNTQTLQYIIPIIFITAFTFYIIIKLNLPKNTITDIKFFLCLSLGLTFNILPIINNYHSIMALLLFYILFVYVIDIIIIREIFSDKKQNFILIIVCAFIILGFWIKILLLYFNEYNTLNFFDKSHPFYNAGISEEYLNRINEMSDYIIKKQKNGIKVIITSYEAGTFMTPLNINNREFDLLNYGNLGYNGINNTIKKIANMQNTEFLIFTDEKDCLFQEPKEIRKYIINNLQKTGEFLNYSIYTNK